MDTNKDCKTVSGLHRPGSGPQFFRDGIGHGAHFRQNRGHICLAFGLGFLLPLPVSFGMTVIVTNPVIEKFCKFTFEGKGIPALVMMMIVIIVMVMIVMIMMVVMIVVMAHCISFICIIPVHIVHFCGNLCNRITFARKQSNKKNDAECRKTTNVMPCW